MTQVSSGSTRQGAAQPPLDVQQVSTATIFGPFAQDAEISELVVDGYKVPYVTLVKENGNRDWTIVMDNRLRATVSEEEIQRWGPLLAQYGARCANMTSHGEDSTYLNPHGPASATADPSQIRQAQQARRF